MKDRIRAKLGKTEPPAAPPAPAGNEAEAALPDDPDTLAARLTEAEAEVER
jgi:hypothetical protein